MPRQLFDRAHQYGIRRREWDRRTAHGYIKMLLRLIGAREMGQNDPPHTDFICNRNESVTFNRSAWWGHNQPLPHRQIICNALYNPSGHRVHVDIPPCKCGCRALHKSITDANNERQRRLTDALR